MIIALPAAVNQKCGFLVQLSSPDPLGIWNRFHTQSQARSRAIEARASRRSWSAA